MSGKTRRCAAYRTAVESSRTMEGINGKQDQATDPLLLDRCPDCGYLLTGLPDAGVCPECGVAYDRTALMVLYGWMKGSQGQFPATRPWIGWLLQMAAWALSFTVLPQLPLPMPGWLPYALASFVPLVYGWVYFRHRMKVDELPDPVQLRLSAQGCGHRVGYGRCKITPWRPEMVLVLNTLPDWRFLGCRWYYKYTHRLEIACTRPEVSGNPPWIEFYFQASPQNAQRIAERVEQWRSSLPA